MPRDEPRNPLATLAVAVSTLNRTSRGGVATRSIGALQRRTRGMRRLITEMVSFARIVTGKLGLRIVRAGFGKVAREGVEERRMPIHDTAVDCADGLPVDRHADHR